MKKSSGTAGPYKVVNRYSLEASKRPMAKVIYWFRTDLRLHDSPALAAALDLKPDCLWPIWTWDPHYVYESQVHPNRWQFLLDCQSDLSEGIQKINSKSRLIVLREAPTTLLPKLFKQWEVTHLVFEKDTDAYGRERDEMIMKSAQENGVEVIAVNGRTLWDPDDIVKANGNKPTMSIKQLEAAAKKLGDPQKPLSAPKSLPNLGTLDVQFDHDKPRKDIPDKNKKNRKSEDKSYKELSGPKNNFAVPTLEELGFARDSATTPIRGGEIKALQQLKKLAKDSDIIASFEKPKTAPTQFDPPATTQLSPHVHFGSIGIRKFYWTARAIEEKKKGISPPTCLTGQLLFREMYFAAFAKIGAPFLRTEGNPHCRFIPWSLRSTDDKDQAAKEWLEKWTHGQTGFPWIDAAMRQLRLEGWIHHLARHAVACFLTRGGCFIAWERGLEVFEELLLDHEPACNAGNWQWLSCTAFYVMYYRIYSPVTFPQKWDKNGDYIRKYVPELKDTPAKFIYEPWKAPKDQRPKDYPDPIFDFDDRRKFCMYQMKVAYDAGKYGTDFDRYDEKPSRKRQKTK